MTRHTVGRGVLAAAAFGCLLAAPVAGQRSALERVEELARMGRPEEARVTLLEWWNDGRGDASRRDLQRGLWLRGRLTVDPVQAELDFQRLVVLYPRGPFSAEALLRLAQAAHAMGNDAAARAHVAKLVEDYPNSPARDEAEQWLEVAGPAPPPPDGTASDTALPGAPLAEPAVAEAAVADSAAGGDPATRPGNAPATAAEPAAPDPARASDPTDDPAAVVVASAGNYFVQLGAFAEEARAMALFEEVTASGIDVRVVSVEGSRFLHVRFGRFVNRAEAADELERLTEAGISAALVRDERPEELVRG